MFMPLRGRPGGRGPKNFVQKNTKSGFGCLKSVVFGASIRSTPDGGTATRNDRPPERKAAGCSPWPAWEWSSPLPSALVALGGWALDLRWKTSPWLLVAGVTIGFVVRLYMLIRAGKQAFKD